MARRVVSTGRSALFIHGGAGGRCDRRRTEQIRRHLRDICDDTARFLQRHSALESVVCAVQHLEDDPLFNAGTGSVLQQDGRVRMSASVMDGFRLRFAGVLNIERVKNPILIAHTLLDEPETVLSGPGATQFARSAGFGAWDPVTPQRQRQWQAAADAPYGTVGAVALDRDGRLAAATSTGGRAMVWPGRVSDSGTPVGNYANEAAAVSCTGSGEEIMHEALASRIAQRTQDGMALARAVAVTFEELKRRSRQVAAISIDRFGRAVWAATVPVLFAIGQTPSRRLETF